MDLPLKIVGQLDSFPLKEAEYDDTFGLECQCFVVADNQVLTEIYTRQADLYKEVASPLRYSFSFNLTGSDAEKMACADTLHQVLNGEAMGNTTIISSGGGGTTIDPTFRIDNRQSEVTGFYNVYGGLFFLGIFLGLTFLMATVVIIYYKLRVPHCRQCHSRYQSRSIESCHRPQWPRWSSSITSRCPRATMTDGGLSSCKMWA